MSLRQLACQALRDRTRQAFEIADNPDMARELFKAISDPATPKNMRSLMGATARHQIAKAFTTNLAASQSVVGTLAVRPNTGCSSALGLRAFGSSSTSAP